MKLHLALIGALSFFALLGCKFQGEYEDLSGVIDFAQSKIISTASGVADGSTPLEIEVMLYDSKGEPHVGVMPTYEASLTGLTHLGCSSTDSSGRAKCRFTSSSAGSFIFRLTNYTTGPVERSFSFDAASKGGLMGAISGSHNKQAGGGHRISTSVGSVTGVPKTPSNPSGAHTDVGALGYKIYIGVQTSSTGN